MNFLFKFKFQKNEKFSKKCKFKKNDENVQKNQKKVKNLPKIKEKYFYKKILEFFIFPKIIAESYFYQKHS